MHEMTAKPATVMQCTHSSGVRPLASQPVAVRRLWPGLYDFEQFELPAEQAAAAIASGLVLPIIPDSDPVTSGPLAAVIRSHIEVDGELAGLARAAAAYAQRTRNVGLLHTVVTAMPRRIAPAGFTAERLRAEYGEGPWYDTPPSWSGHVRDPRAVLLVEHIDRRRAELLVEVFDNIRHGRLIATGIQAATGARTCVPGDLWRSEAVALDMRASGLLVGEATVFCGVEVRSPPPAPRSASRSALDRFTRGFGTAMEAAGRTCVISEIIGAARQHLGAAVSAREVEAAIRRVSPPALAGPGRRPAALVPTTAEIDAAARQAASTTP